MRGKIEIYAFMRRLSEKTRLDNVFLIAQLRGLPLIIIITLFAQSLAFAKISSLPKLVINTPAKFTAAIFAFHRNTCSSSMKGRKKRALYTPRTSAIGRQTLFFFACPTNLHSNANSPPVSVISLNHAWNIRPASIYEFIHARAHNLLYIFT